MRIGMRVCRMLLQAALIAAPALGQGNNPVIADGYTDLGRLPSHLWPQFRVLGTRLQKPGLERVLLSGTVTATGSTTPVDVVFELGGKVKVQGPGRSIVFRKKTNQQAVSASDKAWIESLVDDLADSALPAIASGAQVRLLGRRFSDGSGGFCDMYDIAVPLSDSPTQTRWKRFCFDSATSTLKFVRYPSTLSANATIETQFSDWRVINGQAVPGRIARVEGGVTIFVIQAQSVAVSSRSDDGLFGN